MVNWHGELAWWTGLVDWPGGLAWWTGLVGVCRWERSPRVDCPAKFATLPFYLSYAKPLNGKSLRSDGLRREQPHGRDDEFRSGSDP
jgi:hypothetical protein